MLGNEELDQIVDLQFKGVHHFLQAFVRVMSAQAPTGGSLISLSSATTKAIITNHAAYIGTKRGSEALIECVANDYGHLGIKANTVSPALNRSFSWSRPARAARRGARHMLREWRARRDRQGRCA